MSLFWSKIVIFRVSQPKLQLAISPLPGIRSSSGSCALPRCSEILINDGKKKKSDIYGANLEINEPVLVENRHFSCFPAKIAIGDKSTARYKVVLRKLCFAQML